MTRSGSDDLLLYYGHFPMWLAEFMPKLWQLIGELSNRFSLSTIKFDKTTPLSLPTIIQKIRNESYKYGGSSVFEKPQSFKNIPENRQLKLF